MTEKVYLRDVNFDFEATEDNPLGPHISYTTESVGGAASGLNNPILLKSELNTKTKESENIIKSIYDESVLDEIIQKDFSRAKVSMRLDDFLTYFKEELSEQEQEEAFYHYEQREGGMTPVLNETFFEDRINDMDFMKSMSVDEIYKLTDEQKLKIKLFQSEFEKGLLSGNSPVEGEVEKDSDESINKKVETQEKGENVNMSDDKMVELEKAAKEQADLIKSLSAEVEKFKSEKADRIEKELTKAVGEFAFVEEGKEADLVGVLKALEGDKQDALLAALAKANAKIKELEENADMFVQKSASGEGDYAPEENLREKVSKAVKGE